MGKPNTQENPNRLPEDALLQGHYLLAMEMKYQGASYEQIATATGRTYYTVASWFTKDGTLHARYRAFQAEMNAEVNKEARMKMKRAMSEATDRLLRHIRSENPNASLAAIKELFDREWGKPIQPVIQAEAGQDMIEKWKKELGIDEESISGIREVDSVDLPE